MDVPAGWYPDPAAPGTSARWWDGSSWTEHALPLAELTGAPQVSAYAAPSAETVVLPVAAQPVTTQPVQAQPVDVVAPFAAPGQGDVTDTAVYPLGTAYSGSGPAPAPARGSGVGWGVIGIIAALVVVVVVAAVLIVKGLGSGTGGRTAASPSPTATTPRTPAPSVSGTGSSGSGGSASAADAATVLETFKPSTLGLPDGVAATLIPQGDVAQGEKTLDGWCSSSYTTEKDRIARRQWALTQDGTSIGLSVEAVAYATPEQAAAALAEFTAKTRACTGVSVVEDGGSTTQTVTRSEAMPGLPTGLSGYRAVMTVTGQDTDGTPFSGTSTSTVQVKGQYLSIVWTNQATPVTSGDQHVIDEFVAQQTRYLAATR
jgi:hypothetical protein